MCVFSSCVSVGLFNSLLSGGLTTWRVDCGRFLWRHRSVTLRHGRGQIEHVRVAVDCSRAVDVHISYVPALQSLSRRALFYRIIFWHSYCSSWVFLWGIQIVKGRPILAWEFGNSSVCVSVYLTIMVERLFRFSCDSESTYLVQWRID